MSLWRVDKWPTQQPAVHLL